MADRVQFDLRGQSLLFERASDGGLNLELTIREVDGKRDHIVSRIGLTPVDAERVFALLGSER